MKFTQLVSPAASGSFLVIWLGGPELEFKQHRASMIPPDPLLRGDCPKNPGLPAPPAPLTKANQKKPTGPTLGTPKKWEDERSKGNTKAPTLFQTFLLFLPVLKKRSGGYATQSFCQ